MYNLGMADHQTRTIFKSRLLQVLDYRCPGQDNRPKEEMAEAYEIVLPRAGTYQRRDAHGTFLADPNQVLFFNRNEPYEISHPHGGRDASTIFVIAPSLLIDILRTYDPDIGNLPPRLFRCSHMTLETRLQILQYCLLGENHNADLLGLEEQLLTLLGDLIGKLFQELPGQHKLPSVDTRREHLEQAGHVKAFLNAHVREHLQLDRIATAVHVSPFHLCRVFKQTTGMTIHQYLMRLRLFNAAEQVLENPAERLDVLAIDYGFSNHGHFTTAFRHAFGVNPTDLRGQTWRSLSKILEA